MPLPHASVALAFFSTLLVSTEGVACTFSKNNGVCPSNNAPCQSTLLCSAGSQCAATNFFAGSQGVMAYNGTCTTKMQRFNDVYGTPCTPGAANQCLYFNPLSGSPYGMSTMQCASSPGSPFEYSCRMGPNKAGDACFYNSECASGVCSSRGDGEGGVGSNTCVGITLGGKCTPPSASTPDACTPGYFCNPTTTTCQIVAKTGQPCVSQAGCERGSVCATDGDPATQDTPTCVAYMSQPAGKTNNVGNFVCASGTGLLISAPTATNPRYQCVLPNATMAVTSLDCDPATYNVPGMECECAGGGKYLTRPVKGLGLGFFSQSYVNLNKCLLSASSPNNQLCSYDYQDFQMMRYGSCVFYACYPYYMMLMNNTGGKWYAPPLQQFVSSASCETPLINSYYNSLMSTPCIQIPMLSNWKCMSLNPSQFPPVAGTQALVIIIILGVLGGYIYHMKTFGGHGLPLHLLFANAKQ